MVRQSVATATGLHTRVARAPRAPTKRSRTGNHSLAQESLPCSRRTHPQLLAASSWDKGKTDLDWHMFKMLPTSAGTRWSCNEAQNMLRLRWSSVKWHKKSYLAFSIVLASAHTECRKGGSGDFLLLQLLLWMPGCPWTPQDYHDFAFLLFQPEDWGLSKLEDFVLWTYPYQLY